MSLPSRTKILPDQIPVSADALDAFSTGFRAAAREQDLSLRKTCRYEAWVLAFLAWCRKESTRQVRVEDIEGFRTALRKQAGIGEAALAEAMDALAFSFGEARTAINRLASAGWGKNEPTGKRNADPESEKEILSLQARWHDGAEPSDKNDSSAPSTEDASPSVSSPPNAPTEKDEDTDDVATAEHCIRRFQTKLDAVHSPTPESSEPPAEDEGAEQ